MMIVYQLFFDVNILGAKFAKIQWAGLSVMSLGYAIKVRDLIDRKKEEIEQVYSFEYSDNDYISDIEIKKIKQSYTPDIE